MELNDARYADVVVARLSGRLDQKTSDGVQQGLVALVEAETGPPCMTIDLSGIEYISSVGLRALMVAAKKCKHAEGKLVVAALQPVVLEVFQISSSTRSSRFSIRCATRWRRSPKRRQSSRWPSPRFPRSRGTRRDGDLRR